jgi:nuclear pore complex protein Nup133
MVFVASTKTQLYRLTITARPGTGKFIVVPSQFNDQENASTSCLAPFRILQRKTGVRDSGDIITVISPSFDRSFTNTRAAIAHGYEERPVWVLTNRNLMKWTVNLGGGEKVLFLLMGAHSVSDASYMPVRAQLRGQRTSDECYFERRARRWTLVGY